MVGGEGIKERADFLAMACAPASRCEDLATMENVYSPPIGALNEPIAVAAQNGLAALEGLSDGLRALAAQQLRALAADRRPAPRSPARTATRPARAAHRAGAVLAAGLRPRLPRAARGRCADRVITAMPGSHRQQWTCQTPREPRPAPPGPTSRPERSANEEERRCPRPSTPSVPPTASVLFDTDEKVFEDIKANPGEKAFVFIHTVPVRGIGGAW